MSNEQKPTLNPMLSGSPPGCRLRTLPGVIRHALFASAGALLVQGATMEVASAGPQGGNVVAGQGQISTPDATTTVIQQQSNSLVVNWQTFNVAKNELVRFNQPSSSSSALNRVLNQSPSQIFGSVQANGKVFLLNGSGVVIGKNARVNVGSLFVSSLDTKNEDFMNGRYQFAAKDGTTPGAIINRGLIQAATGGSVTLVGGQVANEGVIVANAGHVTLAAGRTATVDFNGDGLIHFEVDGKVLNNDTGADAAVSNSGEISVDGGQVLLAASAASEVFDRAVNNSGLIRAGSIQKVGGKVTLTGFGGGVSNTGTIDASGTSGGEVRMVSDAVIEQYGAVRADGSQGDGGLVHLASLDTTALGADSVTSVRADVGQGGTVEVLGETVELRDNARVDASGATGGGTVLVGGDYQGSGDTQTARNTTMSADASIDASARESGNGGTVIVWADDVARVFGSGNINASGGAQGGDGGLVETSGKRLLQIGGAVNASASNGQGGLWFLDPINVTIQSGAGATATGGGTNDTDSSIDADTIVTALNGGTNVTIETDNGGVDGGFAGNLTVVDGLDTIDMGGNTQTLTLTADNDLTIQAASGGIVSTNGTLNVVLTADADGNDGGGAVNGETGGDVLISDVIDLSSGTLTVNAVNASLGAVTTSGTQDYSGVTGTTTLNGTLTVDTAGAGVSAGNVTLAAGGGTITLTGTDGANDVTLGTVDGAQALAITADGGDVALGAVGGGVAVSSVTIAATPVSTTLAGAITTGNQTYNGAVTTSGDLTTGAAGTLTFNGTLSTGASDVALTADTIDFTANVSGTGTLTLRPVAVGESIGIAGGAGTLNLAAAELDFLQEGFTLINIGRVTTGEHAIIANAYSFKDSVALLAPAGAGSIAINGQLDTLASGDVATILLDGPSATTTLSANLVTSDSDITISDNVVLGANVTIDTGAGAGNIQIDGTVIADTAANRSLALTAGTGDVTVTGAIGSATDNEQIEGGLTITGSTIATAGINTSTLDGNGTGGAVAITGTGGSVTVGDAIITTGTGNGAGGTVTIAGANVTVAAIDTQGGAGNTAADAGNIDLNNGAGSGTVTLGGDLTALGEDASGGIITIGSNAILNTDVSIDATGSELGGNVTFAGTLDSLAASARTLTIAADDGAIAFSNTIGAGVTQELGAIAINSAATVSFANTVEAASLAATTTGTVTLTGDITTSDAAGVNLSAANDVTLASAVTIDSTTGNGAVDLSTAVDGNFALVVNAGSGAVTTAAVGQGTALASLDINSTGQTNLGGDISTQSATGVLLDGATNVDLTSAVTIDTTVSDGAVNLAGGAVDGNFAFVVNAGSGAVTTAATGQNIALASLDLNSTGQTNLGGNISTQSATGVLLDGATNVDLTAAVTIDTSTNNGAVNLANGGAVDGNFALVVSAGSGAVSADALGANVALASLDVDTTGQTNLNGNITTQGAAGVLLDGASNVDLLSAVTIDTTTNNGAVNLGGGAIDGNFALIVNAGTGAVTIAALGQNTELDSLDVNTTGQTNLGGDISTQSATGVLLDGATNVDLTAAVTIDTTNNNGAVNLGGGAVDGNFALVIDAGSGAVTTAAMGQNAALASLDVNSTGQTNLGGNISTQGAAGVLLDGATNVDLTADTTIDTSAGNGAVNLANGGAVDGNFALGINAGSGAVSAEALGANVALASLDINSTGQTNLDGNITTQGAAGVLLDGATNVDLLSALTIDTTTNNGAVNLGGGAVDGNFAVIVNAGSGAVTTAAMGQNTELDSLDVNSTGQTNLGGNISTQSATGVLLDGATNIDLTAATTIDTTNSNGAVNLANGGAVDGNFALVVNAGSGAVTTAAMGQNAALASLDVDSTGQTNLGGNISTQGAAGVLLDGATNVDLTAGTTIDTSAGNGAVNLANGGAVDGNFALAINAGSGAVSAEALGANVALASLDINSTGQTNLDGNITTQGAAGVLLDGATNVDLLSALTIDTTTNNGAVNLGGGAVDGNFAVVVNAGSGAVTTAAMGQNVALASLDVNSTGQTNLGGNISTQSATGVLLDGATNVDLTAATTIDTSVGNGAVNLANGGAVDGNFALAVNAGSGAVSADALGANVALASLDVNTTGQTNLNGDITTQGAAGVLLDGATNVDLLSAVTIDTTTNNGAVNLAGGAVDGNFALVIDAGSGAVTLAASGQNTELASLDVNTSGQTNLGGDISTQSATGVLLDGATNVDLTAAVTIDTTNNNGAVNFGGGAVDGNFALVVNAGSGAVTTAAMGQGIALASLDVNSTGQTNLGGNITTQGATGVVLDGATNVDLTADVVIDTSAGNGAVDLSGGALDGNQALTVTAGTGSVSFAAVGASTALASLTVTSGGATTVDTGGADGEVTVAGNVSITSQSIIIEDDVTSNTGDIALTSTVGNVQVGVSNRTAADLSADPADPAAGANEDALTDVTALTGNIDVISAADIQLDDATAVATDTLGRLVAVNAVGGGGGGQTVTVTFGGSLVQGANGGAETQVYADVFSIAPGVGQTVAVGTDAVAQNGGFDILLNDAQMDALLGGSSSAIIGSLVSGEVVFDRDTPAFASGSGTADLTLLSGANIRDTGAFGAGNGAAETLAFQTTGSLTLTSVGDVGVSAADPLNIDVGTLNISDTGGNDVFIDNAASAADATYVMGNDAAIASLTLTQTANNIILGAAGITSSGAVSITSPGSISGAGTLTGTAVTLVADGGITLSTAATTLDLTNGATAGNVAITEADDVQLLTNFSNAFNGGSLSLIATDGSIDTNGVAVAANNGNVTLDARDASNAGADVNVNGGSVASGSGTIEIAAADDVIIGGTVTATNTVTVEADRDASDTTPDTVGDITGGSLISGTTVTLAAEEGITAMTAATTLDVSNGATAGNVAITEADDVVLANNFSNAFNTGTLSLVTTDGSIDTGGVAVSANNGAVTLDARDVTNAGADVNINGGSVASGTGAISLFAADNVIVGGTVTATNTVTVDADRAATDTVADTSGAISGGSLITGTTVTLAAEEGITATTAATTLDVTNRATAGNVVITEANDVALSGNFSNAFDSGTLSLVTTDGSIDTGGVAVSSLNGALTLDARDASNAGADVNVNGGSVASGTAAIVLAAADNIMISGTVTATNTVTVDADRAASDTTADTSGAISGAGLITGTTVTLAAEEGITATTAAGTLDAANRVTAGNVTITEADAVTVSNNMSNAFVTGTLTLVNNGVLTLNTDVSTAGGAILLNTTANAITQTANVLVDSTNAGGVATGGNITVNATTIDGDAAGTRSLDFNAGSGGTLDLNAVAGSVQALSAFTARGGAALTDRATQADVQAVTVTGGDISIAANTITIDGTQTTTGASGGAVTLEGGGIALNAGLSAGASDISLLGNAGADQDLIITQDLVSGATLNLSATRDILVQALLNTSGSATADINLTADSDNSSNGGVRVDLVGEVRAGRNATLTGSALNDAGGGVGGYSVAVLDDGANLQVSSATDGDVLLQSSGFAPGTADIRLEGEVTTVGGTVQVDAADLTELGAAGVTTLTSNGGAVTFFDNVTLLGDTTVEAGGGAVTFQGTVDGAQTLIVNSSALTDFQDNIGAGTELTALTTDAAGTSNFDGTLRVGVLTINDSFSIGGGTITTDTFTTTSTGSVSADTTINTDAMSIGADWNTGNLVITTDRRTAGTISLGGAGGLSLSNTELGFIAPGATGTLRIGNLAGTVNTGITVDGAITLAALGTTSGGLALRSTGTVTGASGITTERLGVQSNGVITLNGANDVDIVALDSQGTNAIGFTDADGFEIGNVDSITGVRTNVGAPAAVTLTSTGGTITQDAVDGAIVASALTITTDGGATLDTVSNIVTSFNATNTGGGTIALDDGTAGLDIVSIAAGGAAIDLTTATDMTQSGAITNGGTLTATAGNNITLNDAGNQVSGFGATATTGAVALTNTVALALGTVSAGTNATITNSQAVTIGGAVTATAGAASITAAAGNITGAGPVTSGTDSTVVATTGSVSGTTVNAGGMATVTAGSGSVASVNATSGGNLAVNATTGISALTANATGGTATVTTTGGNIASSNVTSTGTLGLSAAAGTIAATTTSGGTLNLTSSGDITVTDDGLLASQLNVTTGAGAQSVIIGGNIEFDQATLATEPDTSDTVRFTETTPTVSSGVNIATNGHALQFTGGKLNISGATNSISTGAGRLLLSNGTTSPTGALTLTSSQTTLGGTITMPAGSALTIASPLVVAAGGSTLTTNALTLGGAVTGTGALTIHRVTAADVVLGAGDPVFGTTNLTRFAGFNGTLNMGGTRDTPPTAGQQLGNITVSSPLTTNANVFLVGAGDIAFTGAGKITTTKTATVIAGGSSTVDASGNITDDNTSLVAPSFITASTLELGAANQIGTEGNVLNVTAGTQSIAQGSEADAQLRNTNLNPASTESVLPVLSTYASVGGPGLIFSGGLATAAGAISTVATQSVTTARIEDDEIGFIDEGVFLLPSAFTQPERSILMPLLGDADFPGDQRPEDPDDEEEWLAFFEDVVREYIASRYPLGENATDEERAAVEALVTSELQLVIAYYESVRERERTQIALESAIDQALPPAGDDPAPTSDDQTPPAPPQQSALPTEAITLGYVGQPWSQGGIGFEVR